MPCGIAIVRWGECKHSMLLKVGCSANCGDDEMCGPEDQQTMVRTLFRWLCEECHTRRAVTVGDARAQDWDNRVAAVHSNAELTTSECNQRVWTLRSCEDWEEKREEAKRVEQVEEIQFAANWTYEYGLAAFQIRHGAAQQEPAEDEPAEDEQQPQAGDRRDAGPAPGPGPEAEPQQSKDQQSMVTRRPKDTQQFKVPPKPEEESQLKLPPKPPPKLKDAPQFELPPKPKKESQFKLPPKPEGQQQPEKKQPDDAKAHQRRRPDINRDNAPQDRILKLRTMQPWGLHVMLDVLRTDQELREALEEQQRRGGRAETATSFRTRNAAPSTPQA